MNYRRARTQSTTTTYFKSARKDGSARQAAAHRDLAGCWVSLDPKDKVQANPPNAGATHRSRLGIADASPNPSKNSMNS